MEKSDRKKIGRQIYSISYKGCLTKDCKHMILKG